MFTLCRENCFVSIDWLTFHHENYVRESWVVYDFPHINNKRIDCLVINLILFKLPDVKDAYIV